MKFNKEQLSLFETNNEHENTEKPKSIVPVATPQWDDPFGLPVDLIGDEYTAGFLFTLSRLEEAAPIYTTPVFRVLLRALTELRSQKKSWSQKSFTVFIGEFVNYNTFYLGFGLGNTTADGELSMFLRQRLETIPAFQEFNSGSSADCVPIFRYDKGFIVEYAEEELGGTSFIDGDDNYGSSQTIYRRGWQPSKMHGLSKSRYAKLK